MTKNIEKQLTKMYGSLSKAPQNLKEALTKHPTYSLSLPKRMGQVGDLSPKALDNTLKLYSFLLGPAGELRTELKDNKTKSNPAKRETWELFIDGLSKNFKKAKTFTVRQIKKAAKIPTLTTTKKRKASTAMRGIVPFKTFEEIEEEVLKEQDKRFTGEQKEQQKKELKAKETQLKKILELVQNPIADTATRAEALKKAQDLIQTLDDFHQAGSPIDQGKITIPNFNSNPLFYNIGNLAFIMYWSDRMDKSTPYFHSMTDDVKNYAEPSIMKGVNKIWKQMLKKEEHLFDKGIPYYILPDKKTVIFNDNLSYINNELPSEIKQLVDTNRNSKIGISKKPKNNDYVVSAGNIIAYGVIDKFNGQLFVRIINKILEKHKNQFLKVISDGLMKINSPNIMASIKGTPLYVYKDMKTLMFKTNFTYRGLVEDMRQL